MNQASDPLTSSAYWDAQWRGARSAAHADRDLVAKHLRGRTYGPRGLFVSVMRQRLGDLRGARVLELGGGGPNLRLLALARWTGAQVTALDYSAAGLEALTGLFAGQDVPVRTIEADLFAWPGTDAPYEAIVHFGLAEHLPDLRPLMDRCCAWLHPGGRMLFTMPNMHAPAAGLWRRWAPENWSLHRAHATEAVREAARAAGFASCEEFFYGPPAVHMAAWERTGPMQRVLTWVQRAGNLVFRTTRLGVHGARFLSQERGFVMRKPR